MLYIIKLLLSILEDFIKNRIMNYHTPKGIALVITTICVFTYLDQSYFHHLLQLYDKHLRPHIMISYMFIDILLIYILYAGVNMIFKISDIKKKSIKKDIKSKGNKKKKINN